MCLVLSAQLLDMRYCGEPRTPRQQFTMHQGPHLQLVPRLAVLSTAVMADFDRTKLARMVFILGSVIAASAATERELKL